MKKIILFVFALFDLILSAATVEWDVFEARVYDDVGGLSIYYYGGNMTPELGLVRNGDDFIADETLINCGFSAAIWAIGTFGDVITEDYVRDCTLVADVWFSDPGKITLSDFEFLDGDEYYLVLVGHGYDGEYSAWVNIEVEDGEILILNSALSTGALYVGGGAIPEPSSGLLIAIGLIAIALRRSKAR